MVGCPGSTAKSQLHKNNVWPVVRFDSGLQAFFFISSSSKPPLHLQWKVNGGGVMTDKDKKHLAELRDQGYTYQQIAEASGIGLSSVKMFFKRNNTPADDSGICAQCKKRLEKDAPKKKRFCSEKCRIKWWAEHPEQLSNAREHQYKCPFCGKVFYSYKPAKFCSLTCYHRSRQKAGEKDV